MNKAQLIEKLSQRTQTTKTQAELMIDATLEIIQETVSQGNDVKLVGFGTFDLLTRKGRKGRNPKTGETVDIPSGKVPRFKPGKEFRAFTHQPKSMRT